MKPDAPAEARAQFMQMYAVLTGWFLEDDDGHDHARRRHRRDPRALAAARPGFKDIELPADQIVAARAYMLVLAILGQLGATNNWFSIGRETVFGDAPVTELGRVEADWLATR